MSATRRWARLLATRASIEPRHKSANKPKHATELLERIPLRLGAPDR